MIFSSKIYDPRDDSDICKSSKEYTCILDLTLNTSSPMTSIVLDSIADSLMNGYAICKQEAFISNPSSSKMKQYESIQATMDYIRRNYMTISSLDVDDSDFSIKVSCQDSDLELQFYIDLSSILYQDIKDVPHECNCSKIDNESES